MAEDTTSNVVNWTTFREAKKDDERLRPLMDDGKGGGGGGGGEPPEPPDAGPPFGSDHHIANELSADLGEDWICGHPSGTWYLWDGRRWDGGQVAGVKARARDVCARFATMVDSKSLQRTIASDAKVRAAMSLASVDRRQKRQDCDFDQDDDWQLNTPAGILQLKNGFVMPHARGRLLTRLAGVAPAPEAECPRWMQFLNEVTGGDKELQSYLQRIAGYCLTGSVEEHAIFFFFGKSRTGKTVFLSIMQALLGDYGMTAAHDMFMASDGVRHSTELADLKGKRLVITGETPENRRWDDSKLKQISGGDPMRANRMRENTIEFSPKCKLLVAGNHRPRLRADDDGMRSRFRVIPFKFRQPVLDKNLTDKLKLELPGIMRWAVLGELHRQIKGFASPRVVSEATDEYFETEDVLGRFLTDCCIRGEEEHVLTEDVYKVFQRWAARVNEHCPSMRIFSQRLALIDGLEKWRHPLTARRGFSGVGLLIDQRDLPLLQPEQSGQNRTQEARPNGEDDGNGR